jgi:hypothetical protein
MPHLITMHQWIKERNARKYQKRGKDYWKNRRQLMRENMENTKEATCPTCGNTPQGGNPMNPAYIPKQKK